MTDVELQYPWALILLILIPATVYLKRRYVKKTGFSAVSFINKKLEPNIVKKYGIDVLGILFIVTVTLALVNVQYSSVWQKTYLESKWIMIVQDLSGSMNRASSERGLTLGDVALNGAQAFINMRHKDDLIGVIAFSSYAKEILKRKSIAIIDTRIRNWQAIDDTNWKQCILDITIEAKSHIALRVWDELTEELQKFINTQPEVIRPFIEDKLSLDVKWV